jgi:arginyl-tRNA synthetase
LKWLNYPTEVCNYIDDTGVQVVDVVTALLYLDPPFYVEGSADFENFWSKPPENQPFDYFCWELYTRFQNEVERRPFLQERKDEVLHEIERGTHPISVFAKELATRIVQTHLETLGQLSIFYDLLNWESDIIRQGFWGATFELLKERGALRLEKEGPNEGCWVVPFGGLVETEEGVRSLDKILVRSNGSVTYTGKDVAYQLWKFGLLKKDFQYKTGASSQWRNALDDCSRWESADRLPHRFGKADRVINVIDTRQSYPQQVVIECLRQTGFEKQADQSVHLAYEVVNLSPQAARILGMEETGDKKSVAMSGRGGTGVKAMDFINRVKQKVIEKADHPMDGKAARPGLCGDSILSAEIQLRKSDCFRFRRGAQDHRRYGSLFGVCPRTGLQYPEKGRRAEDRSPVAERFHSTQVDRYGERPVGGSGEISFCCFKCWEELQGFSTD